MQSARVMIVEEWAVLRRGLTHYLHGPHRVVAEGASCSELLEAFETLDPDVIIAGQLPSAEVAVLDGLLATRREVRLIRLVDAPSADDLRLMLRGSVDAVLSRTCSDTRLLESVLAVLAGEKMVDPRFLPLLYDGETRTAPEDNEWGLTTRECEVLELLATGRTNREIAEALYVGEATVKTHLTNIYTKLGATDRHHAVGRALEIGILH